MVAQTNNKMEKILELN